LCLTIQVGFFNSVAGGQMALLAEVLSALLIAKPVSNGKIILRGKAI
jgi:hypothetical protein